MQTDLFRTSLDKWAAKVGVGLDALARVSVQDLCEAVIDDTPVDLGFLVGNWQPSIGAPVLKYDESAKGTGYAASRIATVIPNLKAGETFFMTNNAVYARRIEYGFVGEDSLGRTYNQAGRHMVSLNIARWDRIVDAAVVKLGLNK